MKKILIGTAMIVMVAILAGPVAAHQEDHTCPPGEVWGVDGQDCHQVYVPPIYGQCQICPSHEVAYWETHNDIDTHQPYNNLGDCVSDLQHHGHTHNDAENTCKATTMVYDCNSNGWIHDSCSSNHGKPLITPGHFEEQCHDTYGCVAGCDCQHPCPEGQHCDEGTCVENPPTTCPDVPCEEGYRCVDHECAPDVCGVDFTCGSGYHCEENSCTQDVQSGYWPAPFTTTACNAFMGQNRPLDDVTKEGLPVLPLKNTLVKLDVEVPQMMTDCVGIAWYGNGEILPTGDTPHIEYYNFQQLKEVNYGQHVVVQAKLPVMVVRFLAVKDELCDDGTVMHILVTDSHGNVGLDVYTKQRVYDEYFALPDDFQGWRPTTDTLLFPIEGL
jgi:hypothetical protein